MANRTYKFYGNAFKYGTEDVQVTINFNGQQVYSGPVPSSAAEPTPTPEYQPLCSWTADSAIIGQIPVSVTVQNGIVACNSIWTNMMGPWDIMANAPATLDSFAPCGYVNVSDDTKNDVKIDNVAQQRTGVSAEIDNIGNWTYMVPSGSTITWTQTVVPAV